MILKVLGSSSSGNCYILETKTEAIVIDAGVRFSVVQKALNYNISKIAFCLSDHIHQDHSKYVNFFCNAGIKVFSNFWDNAKFKNNNHLPIPDSFTIGDWKIKTFELKHDVPCKGFYINHPDSGNILFITDSYYVPQTFSGINHILCEVNYSEDILNSRTDLHPSVRNRVIQSHMSLETFKEFLGANDLSKVRNIVLLHLSSGNSDSKLFQKEVEQQTGKDVFVAESGMSINIDLNPF